MATADTARLVAELTLKDKLSAGVRTASASVDKLDKKFGNLNRSISKGASNAGRNIGRGIELGAIAAGGALIYATKQAVDWESAIAGVNKTVEATPAQLAAISKGIRELATEMPIAATDLADIAANAGALGIKQQDILSFTRTVALLATTTNVSADDAATALGQLGNVIGLTGKDFDNFAAALVDLGNKGASTEAQILEIERRAGGAAKLIGVAKEATLGWAAAAANLGLNEELAGTALQNFFIKASQHTKDLAKVAGLTGRQFKTMFNKDASGALELFLKKLGKMPKDARIKTIQGIFGKSSGLTRLLLGLAGSVDKNLNPALEDSVTAWKENTAAQAEYEKRAKTTAAQLQILQNNVNDAAITIGSELLPSLVDLSKEGVAWIKDNQPAIKQFGQDLARAFKDAVGWLKSLNWGAIAGALQSAAGFAKGLVEAFLGMPAWVQTAVITGWGLNKLTGGALTDIISELGKGLIKGVLGITAAVVKINAGTVVGGGGGVPGVGGGVPGVGGAGGSVAGAGAAAAIGLTTATIGLLAAGVGSAVVAGFVTSGIIDEKGGLGPALKPVRDAGQTLGPNLRVDDVSITGDRVIASGKGGSLIIEGVKLPLPPSPIPAGSTSGPTSFSEPGIRALQAQTIAIRETGSTTGQTIRESSSAQEIATTAVKDATVTGLSNVDSTTRSGLVGATSAVNASAARITGAIYSSRPIVTTTVTVNVTPVGVTKATTTATRYGPIGDSREAGVNDRGKGG